MVILFCNILFGFFLCLSKIFKAGVSSPPKVDTNLQFSLNASVSSQQSGYWTFGRSGSRPAINNQWVDVWLFTDDYSFDLETNSMDSGFPMLLMQLAHILLLNKVWEKAAGLRVMLVVPNSWTTEDQNHFDALINELRLKIDDVVVFKEPNISLVC